MKPIITGTTIGNNPVISSKTPPNISAVTIDFNIANTPFYLELEYHIKKFIREIQKYHEHKKDKKTAQYS